MLTLPLLSTLQSLLSPDPLNLKLEYAVTPHSQFSISNQPVIKGLSADHRRIPQFTGNTNALRSNAANYEIQSKLVPNITDKSTILTLAKLAANAYVPEPNQGDWSNINNTNLTNGGGYGWDDDGIRGYIFTNKKKDLLVLSIKGTSTAVWNDGGPTAPNDKENDNLLFSCCCGRVSRMWTPVCGCFLGDQTCDEQCLERELLNEDRYYPQILQVYQRALELVPQAKDVWVTGHSLGGALSSLLGRTYGLPVVTFEAPGEDLAVRRLHLPLPPGIPPWDDHVWHFGHNSDPIFLGTCQGSSSTCALKGYAMETKCHSGLVCTYDTKNDFGWHESVANHRIHVVIDEVLEKYDEVAHCGQPEPCVDCEGWKFEDLEYTSTTKTMEGSTTCTSTSCLSHNWYGQCADYTTVTSVPTTSDCVTRDWKYSCLEYTRYPATECP